MTAPHQETIALLRDAAARRPGHSHIDLDEVLRNGAARRSRRSGRRAAGLTALGTVGVVAAAVFGTAALTGTDGAGPAHQDPARDGAVRVLALLARPATDADRLPTFEDPAADPEEDVQDGSEANGFVPGSARLITTADGVGYYAGTSPDGEVCIAVHLEMQVASSCADLDRFSEQGVWVNGSNYLGYDVTALLLPDRLSDPDPEQVAELLARAGLTTAASYEVMSPNLLSTATTPGG